MVVCVSVGLRGAGFRGAITGFSTGSIVVETGTSAAEKQQKIKFTTKANNVTIATIL